VLSWDLRPGSPATRGNAIGPPSGPDATVTFAFSKIGLPSFAAGAGSSPGEVRFRRHRAFPRGGRGSRPRRSCSTRPSARALVPAPAAGRPTKGDAGRLLGRGRVGRQDRRGEPGAQPARCAEGGARERWRPDPRCSAPALAGRPEAMSTPLPGDRESLARSDIPALQGSGIEPRTRSASGPGIPRGPETAPAHPWAARSATRSPPSRRPTPSNALADQTRAWSRSIGPRRPQSCSPRTPARWPGSSAGTIEDVPGRPPLPSATSQGAGMGRGGGAEGGAHGRGRPGWPGGRSSPPGKPGHGRPGKPATCWPDCWGRCWPEGSGPGGAAGGWPPGFHGRAATSRAKRHGRARDGGRRPGRGHRRRLGRMGQVSEPAHRAQSRAPAGRRAKTCRLGERIGRQLREGEVVALEGELGRRGKTQLARGDLPGSRGSPTGRSRAPTFAIVATYRGSNSR